MSREEWEYREANLWWRKLSDMRRRDIAYVTAAQITIFTIIGDKITSMKIEHLMLSLIAFMIALIGINNERRLYSYIKGFRGRALQIENSEIMSNIIQGMREVKYLKYTLKSSTSFQFYYAMFALSWIVIWIKQF